jgi:hypothetical protein
MTYNLAAQLCHIQLGRIQYNFVCHTRFCCAQETGTNETCSAVEPNWKLDNIPAIQLNYTIYIPNTSRYEVLYVHIGDICLELEL